MARKKEMVKYTVEKSANGDYYVLWKNVSNGHGLSCTGIFKGTRRECYNELKKIRGENNGR